MQLAKVIGTVVCEIKDSSIRNEKIMMVQPLGDDLLPNGEAFVAIDVVKAGPGDIVYVTLKAEASFALSAPMSPVDAVITGIVDSVSIESRGINNKDSIFKSGNSI
jgi:ethanolamine utilization protein EutN